MSLLFLLYYAALAGGFNELLDTKKGTAQEFRVKVSDGLYKQVPVLREFILLLMFHSIIICYSTIKWSVKL